jgi:2-dehydropantoate 2-reductase
VKIAIVGTGAMGSVYAGLLAAAGNEVWAIDVDAAHIAAIREGGLRVAGASGDRVVAVNATTDASEAGIVELVVIATKAMHVRAAAEAAKPLVGEDTVVVSIQNGIGGPQEAADALGEQDIVVGVAGGFGASIEAPGHVHHHGWELVGLGELRGPVTDRIERVAEVWRQAGFKVQTYDDIDRRVWEKLICNVCFSGTCGVSGLTVGEVMDDPDTWLVASRCAVEALEVARALGIALEIDDARPYVRAFGEKIPGARPSVLLDLLQGRPSEIDYLNGAIPRLGGPVGVATPANEIVTALVKARERRPQSSRA